jgi:hypothetical protein
MTGDPGDRLAGWLDDLEALRREATRKVREARRDTGRAAWRDVYCAEDIEAGDRL